MAARDTNAAFVHELDSLMGVRMPEHVAITEPFPGMHGDSSDLGEPDALVGARLRPRPHLNSGAIALPLPDEPDREASFYPPLEMALAAIR